MGRAIDALLRRISRTGLRRGLAGDHWAWFLMAGAAFLLRRARRKDDHVTTIDLEPGERYVVQVLRPGRGRRVAADSAE